MFYPRLLLCPVRFPELRYCPLSDACLTSLFNGTSLYQQGSPEERSQWDVYAEGEFKELPRAIVGAGESQICSTGQRAGNRGRDDVTVLSLESVGQARRKEIRVGFLCWIMGNLTLPLRFQLVG